MKKLQPLNFEHHFLVSPLTPRSGGLVLLWRSDIQVQILSANAHFIDTLIIHKNESFFGSFVYGAPEITNRQAVWEKLTGIAIARDTPWFLTGDFNEIIDNSEKFGGKERSESSFSNFRTFISSCDLFDLRHSGEFLSWQGKHHTHIVHCRLNRSLANSSLSDRYSTGKCEYFPFEESNHTPIFTSLNPTKKKRNRSFRYDRRLRHNEEVHAIVELAWSNSAASTDNSKMEQRSLC